MTHGQCDATPSQPQGTTALWPVPNYSLLLRDIGTCVPTTCHRLLVVTWKPESGTAWSRTRDRRVASLWLTVTPPGDALDTAFTSWTLKLAVHQATLTNNCKCRQLVANFFTVRFFFQLMQQLARFKLLHYRKRTPRSPVATYLRCGGILKDRFVANSPASLPVEKNWKSVNIWGSCGQEFSVLFFWLTV